MTHPAKELIADCTGQTAVMLNANAKRVTPKVVDRLAQIVPADDLFLSHSFKDAREQVEAVVDRGYSRVLTGGGDGTLVTVVNLVERALRRSCREQPENHMPDFGVLRLGTGNAVASILGAGNVSDDVNRHMFDDNLRFYLDMIRAGDDGTLCPFAGIGYDGEVLNDYNWVKNRATGRVSSALMQTALGYLAGFFLRTLPRKLATLGKKPHGKITTIGPAYYVDPQQGDALVPCDREVLYQGPIGLAGAGTVPYYGFYFKVFPFAGRLPGFMHLRIASVGALVAALNMRKAWNGTWRHPGLIDFLVKEVVVEGDGPLPYQIGGDAAGERQSLHLKVSEHPLTMAALSQPPLALPAAA